jgi:hypothetical protein
MKREILIELRKENDLWRMDSANYQRFHSHIKEHFVSDDPLFSIHPLKVRYAEFEVRDLYTVSPFFCMNVSSSGTLALSAFYPRDLSFYREHTFRLYLGVVVQGRLKRYPLTLKFNK